MSECFTHWSCDELYPLNRTKYHKLRYRYLASKTSSTSHLASGSSPSASRGSSCRGRPSKGSSLASSSLTTGKTGWSFVRPGGSSSLYAPPDDFGHPERAETPVGEFLRGPSRLNVRGV